MVRLMSVAFLAGCTGEPPRPDTIPVGDYAFAGEWLDWRLERAIDRDEAPAVAVALIDDQDVHYQRTLGTADRDTLWRVGSVTKLFTALGVLRLAEDGVVDLDAPITDWLPYAEFPSRFEDDTPITARQLLAHRSGLPRNSGLPDWYWEAAEPAEDLFHNHTRELTTQYVAQPPESRFLYSNAGFNVLAALTEAATGELWVFHVYDQIFAPIGMHDSVLALDHLPSHAEVAVGHADVDGASVESSQFDIIGMASGNQVSSVADLTAFARWVFRDGDGLLEPDTLWDSFEPQYAVPRDPETHGLGWETTDRRFDEPLVFHTGTIQGTRTMLGLLPESRLGVVVVGNSDRFAGPANEIAVQALEHMLDARGTPTQERERPDTVDLERDRLDRFEGIWVLGGDPVDVWRKGDKLKARYQGFTVALRPIGEDRFAMEHWLGDPGDVRVRFHLGDPDLMVVDLERVEYKVGLRYDVDALPLSWHDLVGRYRRAPRVSSAHWDADASWPSTVTLTDEGVLTLPGMPLWPISDTELLVVGGEWDGETVLWDPDARTLTHGSNVWTWRGDLQEDCGCATRPGAGSLAWALVPARRRSADR